MDGSQICNRKKRSVVTIIVRSEISFLLDPAKVCKGNYVITSPLEEGEYGGERVTIPIGDSNVIWILIFDHNNQKWKGKEERLLRNDPNVQIIETGG